MQLRHSGLRKVAAVHDDSGLCLMQTAISPDGTKVINGCHVVDVTGEHSITDRSAFSGVDKHRIIDLAVERAVLLFADSRQPDPLGMTVHTGAVQGQKSSLRHTFDAGSCDFCGEVEVAPNGFEKFRGSGR